MKKINIELWILCILILFIVAGLTWYALRKTSHTISEEFQSNVASGNQAKPRPPNIKPAIAMPPISQSSNIAASFWSIMQQKNDPEISTLIEKVSDPDPNDENDVLPLSFPTHISMYSLAAYNMDVSGARASLFLNYDALQRMLSTTVYDQRKVNAWSTSPTAPIIQTCSQLDALKAIIQTQLLLVKRKMQDLSGTQVAASKMKDENMAQQLKLLGICQVLPPPDICKNLATQDGPFFPLLGQYETANDILAGNEEDIQNALVTVNDTFSVLGCGNPKLSFDSESDAGYINTDELRINLQRISPYYLSPDTLKSILGVIVPGGKQLTPSISTTADALIDINNVIRNIKLLTNTT
jgi:hypothetical protein